MSAERKSKRERLQEHANRKVARRLFPLGPCADCGARGQDRHHIDGNTANNTPENIVSLCRRCHMQRDGRAAALGRMGAESARNQRRLKACVECAREVWNVRRGMCSRCHSRARPHRAPSPTRPDGTPKRLTAEKRREIAQKCAVGRWGPTAKFRDYSADLPPVGVVGVDVGGEA